MVISLGVALWANLLVWTVGLPLAVDRLPYPEADRIVRVWQTKITSPTEHLNAALGNFVLWRERCQTAESVAGYATPVRPLLLETTEAGGYEAVRHVGVTEGFFETLGVTPALGRAFVHEERRLGYRAVVLSHGYWHRRFGGDPGAIGKTIGQVGGARSVVVGVMPHRFDYPPGTEVWFPAYIPDAAIRDQNSRDLLIVAKLKANVAIEDFRRELLRLRDAVAREFPKTDVGWVPVVAPIRTALLGAVQPALVSLHVIVGLLGLLGVASVLTLIRVHTGERMSEYAIQLALGAPQSAPRRQLLAEGVILAVMGFLVAALAARWTMGWLLSWLPPSLPQLEAVRLEGRLLCAGLLAAVFAGIVSGLAAARDLRRLELARVLTVSSRTETFGWRSSRRRHFALTLGVAIAFALVAAALVAVLEVRRLREADTGFTPEGVVVARIGVPIARLQEVERDLLQRLTKEQLLLQPAYLMSGVTVAEEMAAQVKAIPGVRLAAVSGTLPMVDSILTTFVSRPESGAADLRSEGISAFLFQASEDYFRILDAALLRGRFFDERDRLGREPAAIVSYTLARRLWGDGDCVGKLLTLQGEKYPIRVVGVVGDMALSSPGTRTLPALYRPYAQSPPSSLQLMVSTHVPAARLRPALGEVTRRLGAQLISVQSLSDVVDVSVAPARRVAEALSLLGVMAGVLAFVGLYANASAALQYRERELGIRMVFGAPPASVYFLIVRTVMAPALVGVAFGIGIAMVLGGAMSAWFSLPSVGAVPLAVTAGLVSLGAALASVGPCVRAGRRNVVAMLR